jgi:NADPH-dependent ferric siderophore reductase
MPAPGSPERLASKPGPLRKAVTRLWMKPAIVTANEPLAGRFYLITLEGAALKGIAWLPGQKVQIAMGSVFVTRTYTPIEWDASTGRMCILGYAHGEGPGSAWVRSVARGEECEIFGPRASLDLSPLPGPLIIAGDETVLGLAYAATHQDRARRVSACLEVEDVESAQQAAAHLGLEGMALFAKSAGETHLAAMEAALAEGLTAGASCVLAGKAGTIQRLRQSLKERKLPAARLITKAYWAPGKTGLD